jgi:hypothetical protein
MGRVFSSSGREDYRIYIYTYIYIYKLFVGKPEGINPIGNPRFMWVCHIKMNLEAMIAMLLTGLVWRWIGQVEGSCQCRNEHSVSMKS